MIHAYFDYERFYAELDRIRQERGLTWYQIFKQTAVSAFHKPSRMRANGLSLDSLAVLCTWAELDANDFICMGQRKAVAV